MKEIDIAATLEHVRDQRPGMVRTKVTLCLLWFGSSLEIQTAFPTLCTLIIYSEPQTEPHTLPQNVGFKPQHLHLDLRLYIHVYKYVWFISALNVSSSLQDQFEFALTAVAEEVNAILKALPQ